MQIPPSFLPALRRRDPLRVGVGRGATDAFRLLDGAGDGPEFAGLFIDDFAGRWLVSTAGPPPAAAPPEWLRTFARSGHPDAPRSVYWKALDNQSKNKGGPVYWVGEPIDAPFTVRENGLRYRIDFSAGYSQGIFLDQRDNRLALRRVAVPGTTTLNCFAYTCAFSVAAAAGGGSTVSVDLSKHYLDWGRGNFAINGFDTGLSPAADASKGHAFIAGDVPGVLRRFVRQGRKFGCIVLDPPTFSRNRGGKVFRVEDDFGGLVTLAAALLAPDGYLLCSTNQRSLPAPVFRRMVLGALPPTASNGACWKLDFAPMPPDFTGESYLQSCWVHSAGADGRRP